MDGKTTESKSKQTNHNHFQRHRLTNTVNLTLKMTSAQVVEKSITDNSSLQN